MMERQRKDGNVIGHNVGLKINAIEVMGGSVSEAKMSGGLRWSTSILNIVESGRMWEHQRAPNAAYE